MHKEQFAEGFSKSPRYIKPVHGLSFYNTKSLLSPAIHWADTFSFLVDAHLHSDNLDPAAVGQILTMYESDITKQLLRGTIRASEKEALQKPELASHLNGLNFHTLNQEMSANWWTLMGVGEKAPADYMDISRMQANLSIQALRLVQAQKNYRNKDQYLLDPKAEHPFDESLTGQITEIDAAITLLEVSKQLPGKDKDGIVVIPSPPHYEGGTPAASDFLIFDTNENQAHGIQVKTRLRGRSKYDENFVSFIDGVSDLGNYQDVAMPLGHVKRQVMPGLISADYLLHSEGLKTQLQPLTTTFSGESVGKLYTQKKQ